MKTGDFGMVVALRISEPADQLFTKSFVKKIKNAVSSSFLGVRRLVDVREPPDCVELKGNQQQLK